MNSETERPTPPRRFSRRRNETSVTPAIGERTNGGLISILRILKAGIMFLLRMNADEDGLRLLGFLVVLLLFRFGGDGSWNLQQRIDARAISVSHFYERLVAQSL